MSPDTPSGPAAVGPPSFRPTVRQVAIASAVPAAFLVFCALFVRGALASLLLGAALGSLGMGLLRRRSGVDLGDDAVVVRGLTGSRRVPWTDITDVVVSERTGGKVLVLETAERLYRLAAPFSSRGLTDPAFEAKARVVSEFWRVHRGRGPRR